VIFFDLDGVIRDLCGVSENPPDDWALRIVGLPFSQYIDENLSVLTEARPTKYYEAIAAHSRELTIISHQREHWRALTSEWLARHFKENEVTVIYTPRGGDCKMEFLKEGDFIVEDYPFFSDYSRVILIDYPYNRHNRLPAARVTSPAELTRAMEGRRNNIQ